MKRALLTRISQSLRTAPRHSPHAAIPTFASLLRTRATTSPKFVPNSPSRYFSSNPPRQAQYVRFGGAGGQLGGGPGSQPGSQSTAKTVVIGLGVLAGTYYVAQYVT